MCADINEKGAAATVEKITSLFGAGRAISIKADVSKEEDVKKMIHLAVSEFGKKVQAQAYVSFLVVVVVVWRAKRQTGWTGFSLSF